MSLSEIESAGGKAPFQDLLCFLDLLVFLRGTTTTTTKKKKSTPTPRPPKKTPKEQTKIPFQDWALTIFKKKRQKGSFSSFDVHLSSSANKKTHT